MQASSITAGTKVLVPGAAMQHEHNIVRTFSVQLIHTDSSSRTNCTDC